MIPPGSVPVLSRIDSRLALYVVLGRDVALSTTTQTRLTTAGDPILFDPRIGHQDAPSRVWAQDPYAEGRACVWAPRCNVGAAVVNSNHAPQTTGDR